MIFSSHLPLLSIITSLNRNCYIFKVELLWTNRLRKNRCETKPLLISDPSFNNSRWLYIFSQPESHSHHLQLYKACSFLLFGAWS